MVVVKMAEMLYRGYYYIFCDYHIMLTLYHILNGAVKKFIWFKKV